jgi:hypothetical protein
MEWLWPAVVAFPWGLAGIAFDAGQPGGRVWITAVTVGGAALNGLIFTQLVRWVTLGPRRPPDPQTLDYDDPR